MKMKTIEEKAKRYDDLLVKLQEAKVDNDVCDERYCCVIDDIVPELKESEGERIRKAIINVFATHKDYEIFFGASVKDILAWLEKQGGQNHVNTPKFHEGDWIVHHGTENIYQVVAIIDNQYQLKYGDNYTVQKCADVDRCARLWDITKDAKDGDVLADNGTKIIFIFKNTEYDSHIESKVIKYFIRYSFDGINLPLENGGHLGVVGEYSNFVPATKEQREFLFQKMKDAGYTFDFEKKELKKIEQKPQRIVSAEAKEAMYDKTAWSEEDEYHKRQILRILKDNGCSRTLQERTEKWIEERLKSIRPQSQWKPSDEQMDALETAVSSLQSTALESLYNKLKKL